MAMWSQLNKGWRSKRSMGVFSVSSSYWMTVTAVNDQPWLLHKLLDDAQRLRDANTVSGNFQKTSKAENKIHYFLEIKKKKKRLNCEQELKWKSLGERDVFHLWKHVTLPRKTIWHYRGSSGKGGKSFTCCATFFLLQLRTRATLPLPTCLNKHTDAHTVVLNTSTFLHFYCVQIRQSNQSSFWPHLSAPFFLMFSLEVSVIKPYLLWG